MAVEELAFGKRQHLWEHDAHHEELLKFLPEKKFHPRGGYAF
jgi:hypothetical protein